MQNRLLLAIVGTCTLAAVAAAVGLHALSAVERSLLRLADRDIPAALASQAIARQSQKLAAAGPALSGVESLDHHAALSGGIATDVEVLNGQLARIKGFGVGRSIRGSAEALAQRLRRNLGAVEILAANRIVLAERRQELMRRLFAAYAAAESALQPRIAALEADVFALRKQIDEPRRPVQPPAMEHLSALLTASTSLQAALAEASTVTALLARAAAARRAEEIEALEAPLRRALYQLDEVTPGLEPDLREAVAAQATRFHDLFEGPESLFRLRRRELDQALLAERRIAENNRLSRRLAEAADRLTARAQQSIEAGQREADAVAWLGLIAIAAAGVFGLIGAAAAAWLAVRGRTRKS